MARFQDLSVDLLFIIFSQLQDDKPSLHNLSLSCRLFRSIAQQFYVRNAIISHSDNRRRTELFLRTLEERPDLTGHVHRLQLDLRREDEYWVEDQKNIRRITELLTNLREFRYSSVDYKIWHYENPFPWPVAAPSDRPQNCIRRIEWHHNMTTRTLQKCMSLPRIQTIYLRELHETPLEPSGRAASGPKERFSSVAELTIGSTLTISPKGLQEILKMPRALRKLRLDVHDNANAIEPRDLAAALDPVRDTLEQLTIAKPKGGSAVGKIDLCAFHALKSLALPFRYLLAESTHGTVYADLRLPPALRDLKIYFLATPSGTNYGVSTSADTFKSLVAWLSAMCMAHPSGSAQQSAKFAQMPDLRRIVLETSEYRGPPHGDYYGSLNSDLDQSLVQDLAQACKAFGDDSEGRLEICYQRP